MHSRVTLLEIDTLRMDISTALEAYRSQVLPRLREEPGFEGVYVLVSEEGKGLILTLWSSPETMAASTPIATEALSRFATVFKAPPGREQYEVLLAELVRAPVASP
ncbi:MAG: hypothetical protein ACXVFK_15820 [Solirubrobacteraceae bacterium]